MRKWFYRKVVLSASPCPDKYAAMIIFNDNEWFGSPAFATADDPAWRLAPSCDGVEDAIHHNGRFYSITYSSIVEAWHRNAETREYRSTAVGQILPGEEDVHLPHCKYIAASPYGQLMALLKEYKKVAAYQPAPIFKVLVLDECRKQWVETQDIGDAVLFVSVNNFLCLSRSKCSLGITAGCVYYTDDELGQASLRLEPPLIGLGERRVGTTEIYYRSSTGRDRCNYQLKDLGMYNLKDGTVKKVEGLPRHKCWPTTGTVYAFCLIMW